MPPDYTALTTPPPLRTAEAIPDSAEGSIPRPGQNHTWQTGSLLCNHTREIPLQPLQPFRVKRVNTRFVEPPNPRSLQTSPEDRMTTPGKIYSPEGLVLPSPATGPFTFHRLPTTIVFTTTGPQNTQHHQTPIPSSTTGPL